MDFGFPDAFFRVVFEEGPLPMWVFDSNTFRILAVNRAALQTYEYTQEEFLRVLVTELRPAEHAERFKAYIREMNARRDRAVAAGNWEHQTKSGRRITAAITALRLPVEHG